MTMLKINRDSALQLIGANKLSQNRYGKILDTFPTKKKADQFVNNINNAVAQYIQGDSK